jgi:predicted glycoside hydrolase/deacetylase ChbG (UPF0249 family)
MLQAEDARRRSGIRSARIAEIFMGRSISLIVNADDFGMSPGINRGIIRAREQGIVTSASLMTRWAAAPAAAEYGRANPAFGLGLHIDLGEWARRGDSWEPLYQVVPTDDPAAVRDEVHRQLDAFRQLVGRDPDHLDSHQHVHRDEPVRSIACQIGRELHIPVRHFSPTVAYCGDFYGQGRDAEPYPELITFEALESIIRRLPAGVTELCCHPALGMDIAAMYADERERELQALCDPRLAGLLADCGIRLCTFSEVRDE